MQTIKIIIRIGMERFKTIDFISDIKCKHLILALFIISCLGVIGNYLYYMLWLDVHFKYGFRKTLI